MSADTVHLASGNLTESEKDTLQSPSAHPLYLAPPSLGAFVFCGAWGFCVAFGFRALGFCVASASRDPSTVEKAEGSASPGLGEEGAPKAAAEAAVSGLDGVAPADEAALDPQPATAKTSSSAPVAVRFVEESQQCCMRGV
jgi:hypothetical protein